MSLSALNGIDRRPPTLAEKLFPVLLLAVPVAGLLLFFMLPMAAILLRSLSEPGGGFGLANYAAVMASRGFQGAVWNSLKIGLATTVCATGLGFLIAHAVYRCRLPFRGLLLAATALPMLAPSLVQGLGLIFLLGRNGLINKTFGTEIEIYGFWGLLIANTLYALPQAVLILGAALRQADARLYEAATVMGTPAWRQFFDLTLPNVKYGLLSCAFVIFTVTITDFGNAAVIGGDYSVLATEIYNQVVGQMNINLGAVVGILLLVPTVLAFYIERVASQRQFGTGSDGLVPYVPFPSLKRDLPMGLAALLVALLPVAVIGVVIYGSFMRLWPYRLEFTLRHYDIRLAGGYDSLWGTVLVSLAAAALGTLLLTVLTLALRRASGGWSKVIYFMAILPASVPGMVIGLGYVIVFNNPATPLNLLYGSAVLLVLCNFYHYHAQGFVTATTGLRQIPATIEEAAGSLGAGPLAVMRDVLVPQMLPTLASVFFFLFMNSMVTLSAVIFLVTPSLSLASVTVMRLDEAGFVSQAAAFSTCIMGIVMVSSLLMRLTMRTLNSPKRRLG